MDNLAREAMLARQANMTYGKWKAMQKPIVQKKKDVIPEGWRKCKGCGKAFKPRKANNIFCDIGCRTDYYNEKFRESKREYMQRYRDSKKKDQNEDICGKLVSLLQGL